MTNIASESKAERDALLAALQAGRDIIGRLLAERDALRAKVSIYEKTLLWMAEGRSPLARDYATTAEKAMLDAAIDAARRKDGT